MPSLAQPAAPTGGRKSRSADPTPSSPLASSQSDSEDSDASGSESDQLDSPGPRKRRRTDHEDVLEPDTDDESDGEQGGAPVVAPVPLAFEAPSRIKRKPKDAAPAPTAPELPPAVDQPGGKILAPVDPNTTFDSLNVRPWLVQSLKNMAIHRPTGIQKGCIPEILKGRDCIGGSRTGSGKTVAFAAPILQKWAEDPHGIFAVVLTPTRELALQIYEQFSAISSPRLLKALLITGGSDMRSQAIALAGRPHIVIATPGRLADHIRTSGEDTVCGLRRVKFVVLDEADRLLGGVGKGSMLPDVEECFSALPPPTERQTLLFTATMTPEVMALKSMPPKEGKEPAFVCEVDTAALAVPATLRQTHLKVPVTHREHFLHALLLTEQNVEKTVIVFCNRTATAEFLHHLLRLLDHRVTSLHSKLPQRQRTDNLGRFRASAARILIATDVAARGLDIPEVSLVINYDVPRATDDYIHRVGRTARAGRKGEAITFVGQRDVELVLGIEERVGSQMDAWEEEGVNLETRVLKEMLKLVSEKKREALLEIEEGREVGGKRKRGKEKLRAGQ
ncbi:probable ATP-dependent RNA helicase DBP8 [Cephalotrichum gorgonifer]|uniref:Probable ATP-dependent RNA helicase DBP8 n=1 Tax=Cephalotrichum gorgonifer TaxID=2041049 RepID=A0AAE8N161_9PEZI|nr:probable ATP-dependent RNA helicase DBP8 [Cephalotrichum gorgonifer]